MKKIISNDKGFSILAVILVIVAVIVAIGVWALSGQTNTSNSSNSATDIQATSIMNNAAAIKSNYDRLVIEGNNYKNIVFIPNTASTATAPNILDPVNGIQVPTVNKNALRSGIADPEGIWVYNPTSFTASYVGDRTLADPSIMIAGIKDSVCQRINNQLYGSTYIPKISGYSAGGMFVSGATSAAPTSNATIGIFVPEDMYWTSGCISANATADNNLYFMVLKAI